jgi:hypothetical protein
MFHSLPERSLCALVRAGARILVMPMLAAAWLTLGVGTQAAAQTSPESPDEPPLVANSLERAGVPVSLSFYAPYGVQPGVRVGVDHAFGFHGTALDGRGEQGRARYFFAGPRLAYFTRPNLHRDISIGAELGWRTHSRRRRASWTLSLGLAYLGQSQIASRSIDLSTGIGTNTRELRSYALPTVRYAITHEVRPGFGWFVGASLGRKLSREAVASAFLAFELGVRVRVGNPSADARRSR